MTRWAGAAWERVSGWHRAVGRRDTHVLLPTYYFLAKPKSIRTTVTQPGAHWYHGVSDGPSTLPQLLGKVMLRFTVQELLMIIGGSGALEGGGSRIFEKAGEVAERSDARESGTEGFPAVLVGMAGISTKGTSLISMCLSSSWLEVEWGA